MIRFSDVILMSDGGLKGGGLLVRHPRLVHHVVRPISTLLARTDLITKGSV
jgi:hypothetical protein